MIRFIQIRVCFSIITFFSMIGCVEIQDLSRVAPKLSLNCLFSPDSNWTLTATQGDGSNYVKHLELFIREQSGMTTSLEWCDSLSCYKSNGERPQEGKIYELCIIREGKAFVLSESQTPTYTKIDNPDAIQEGSVIRIGFDFRFNKNIPYYSFQVRQQVQGLSFIIPIGSANFDFENKIEDSGVGYSYVILKNDQQECQFRFVLEIIGERISKDDYIQLYIESCSTEVGRYLVSLQKNSFEDISSIYSNIEGELGIWGGYNRSIVPIMILHP